MSSIPFFDEQGDKSPLHTCVRCGVEKELYADFPISRKTANGHKNVCFVCARERDSRRRALNSSKSKEETLKKMWDILS